MFIHDPNLTCLAQSKAFDAGHRQIERYTYSFAAPDPSMVKESVRIAIFQALEARARRNVKSGRMHVELDSENPGCGRVVDHLPRDGATELEESERSGASTSAPRRSENSSSTEPATEPPTDSDE